MTYNKEFTKFIRDLAFSLKAKKILEVGCGLGNNLREFDDSFEVYGIDPNQNSIEFAKKSLPQFNFKVASVLDIPFENSFFDFVFSYKVFNSISEENITNGVNELFRVSKKYITNCELFDETEKILLNDQNKMWYRNMLKRWMSFKVKIISNVDMHEDIDPEKTRFTLVRKI